MTVERMTVIEILFRLQSTQVRVARFAAWRTLGRTTLVDGTGTGGQGAAEWDWGRVLRSRLELGAGCRGVMIPGLEHRPDRSRHGRHDYVDLPVTLAYPMLRSVTASVIGDVPRDLDLPPPMTLVTLVTLFLLL